MESLFIFKLILIKKKKTLMTDLIIQGHIYL